MQKYFSEPYRIFFPLGILFLLTGSLLWVPLLWDPGTYPVVLHRFCMLNGFVGSFIAGFLMTAIPKFSQTESAGTLDSLSFLMLLALGSLAGYLENDKMIFLLSSLQALVLLVFLFRRILKRKANPPYTFIFVPIGLMLWFLSGILSAYYDSEAFKNLHFEGALTSIILGVGSRLLPGIFGHTEIVSAQKAIYEKPLPFIKIVPVNFLILVLCFCSSYFLSTDTGEMLRAGIVCFVGVTYWRLLKLPVERTALTMSLWCCGWLILLSFILKALWRDDNIHVGHAFFLNGVVLLCLLIATRVIQSHGPKDKNLENSKVLYLTVMFIFTAAVMRVSAFLIPEHYLHLLSCSALMLTSGVILWSSKFLRFVGVKNSTS